MFALYFMKLGYEEGNPTADSVIEVSAVKNTGHGVALNTEFLLTCSGQMSEQQIRDSIEITPQLTYTLNEEQTDRYALKFDTELASNSIVHFSQIAGTKPHTWAFQTEEIFRITQTLPANKENNVPVNSGIEIGLSYLEVNNFADSFTIEPAVNGKFEKHGKTFVFVPDQLSENTRYQVTVSKALESTGGETLSEDYTFSFRTQTRAPKDNSYLYITGETVETFAPDVTPVIEVMASDHYSDTTFTIQAYKFQDADSYLAALSERRSYLIEQFGYSNDYFTSSSGLDQVLAFETTINRANPEETWLSGFFVFPDKLPEGQYLVDIFAEDEVAESGGHIQKLIQIHPYAVYVLSIDGEELVWVNDTRTGEPVANAETSINGISAATGVDGTARISTPYLNRDEFINLKVMGDQAPFVTELIIAPSNDNGAIDEQYYTYMYTDREKYQPTDTISIWGVVLSKDGKSKPPNEAELQLNIGSYDNTPLKTEVTLDASGAFTGTIAISGLSANYYELKLLANDVTYCHSYISVGEYVKPSYIIETELAQPVYFANETIMLNGSVTFFDGTPAGNTPFEVYNGGPISKTTTVTTDASGLFQEQLQYGDLDNTWVPQSLYYSVMTAGAEDVMSMTTGNVLVLPRDIMVQTVVQDNPDGFSIGVETNRIDVSMIEYSSDVYEDNYKNIKGEAVSIPITVEIYEVTWNKIQIGSYYDFLNKVTVAQYNYSKSEKQVEERSGSTVNGSLMITQLAYNNTPEKYYYATVSCSDLQGNRINQQVYFYNDYYPDRSGIKYYRFSHDGYEGFSLQETIRISLLQNEMPVQEQGKLLYATVQNSLKAYQAVDSLSFDYVFNKSDIPNIQITGAYFDGKNLYPVWSDYLSYDPEEMKLNVVVTPSADSFLPDSEVSLTLAVTDLNNKPVEGAAVCVSVVDEAAFAVADQLADPLRDIYSKYTYAEMTTFTSYVQHDFSGSPGYEGGGEGGSESVRKNFLDTAAFLTATTDHEGYAELAFQLPDNLTSWRVTSLAISEDVTAGTARINIKTTQPFFADLLVGKVFIKGDTLSAVVRGFGTALKSSDIVSFDAVLSLPDGTQKTATGSSYAGSYQNINFGVGVAGNYTLSIIAKSGTYTDRVEKAFRVVDSALEIPITKTFALSDGIAINALRSPVTLSFFDQSQALYNECLQSLASGYGVRADIQVSRAVAQQQLKVLYGRELPYYFYGAQTESVATGSLQDYTGGVKLLAYGEPEVELTAKLCAAAPEQLNTIAATTYLMRILERTDSQATDVAAAYMGLAALHEPVLLDIRYLLENEKSLGLKEELYLIAGLALIGDVDTAQVFYDDIVRPLLVNNDPWTYLNSGETKDTDIEYTALAAITAMQLGDSAADQMVRYIIANSSNEVTTCLERLFYVRIHPQMGESNASFSYLENGVLKTISIENNHNTLLSMTVDELKVADIKAITGEVGVCATFIGRAADVVNHSANFVTLKKTIEPQSGDSVTQSSLVKITLAPTFSEDAPYGLYELSDYIPSGLRYVAYEESWNYNWWLEGTEGQKINFSVENIDKRNAVKANNYKQMEPIVYYARATMTGTFVVDSALIKHIDTATWGMSERNEIRIGE